MTDSLNAQDPKTLSAKAPGPFRKLVNLPKKQMAPASYGAGAIHSSSLLKKFQCDLRLLVRLREDGGAGLLQNVLLGHIGCFTGEVDVFDARLGGTQGFNLDRDGTVGLL